MCRRNDEVADIREETPSLSKRVIEHLWDRAFTIARRDAEAQMGYVSTVAALS